MRYPQIIVAHAQRLSHLHPVQLAEHLEWIVIEEFPLPPRWSAKTTKVLIRLPESYPLDPPGLSQATGIFLPASLRYNGGEVLSFHGQHASDAQGWSWWCYSRIQSWDPKHDDFLTILDRLRFDLGRPIAKA